MFKKILIIILFFLVSSLSVAGANYNLITDVGISAKSISLGGIGSFNDSADVIFDNPAGLSSIKNNSLSIFQTTVMQEVHYYNVSYAGKTPIGTFGVGFMNAYVTGIPYTGLNGNNETFIESYYDYNNYIYKIGYAYNLTKNLALGASLVGYNLTFHDISGSGNDFDIGCILSFDNLDISFVVQQGLNSNIKYNNDGIERLQNRYSLSAKYQISDVKLFGQLRTQELKYLYAAAVSYNPEFLKIFELNFGYKQFLVLGEVRNGITVGLGLLFDSIKFHYAFEKSDHFEHNNKNYFTIAFDF
ncbi:type IX secretion system membrane protein PorP/SprF [Candidatus Margulisiibacteriota bacterium]